MDWDMVRAVDGPVSGEKGGVMELGIGVVGERGEVKRVCVGNGHTRFVRYRGM